MKQTLLLAAVTLAISSLLGAAQNQAPPYGPFNANTNDPLKNQAFAWLGVSLRPVPAALSEHLGDALSAGRGVLVVEVGSGSPAEKAGLAEHDILLNYGDQPLYSPRQLMALVRSGKPGDKVDLKAISKGKVMNISVELAESPRREPMQRPGFFPFRGQAPMPAIPSFPPGSDVFEEPLAWDSFESIQVKTLPDGRYRAEVKYKTGEKETRSFTFEGKREEITEQIEKQEGLPEAKKQALLQALNLNPVFGPRFPQFRMPNFEAPAFQHPFADDPFFQQFPDIRRSPYFQRFFPRPDSDTGLDFKLPPERNF